MSGAAFLAEWKRWAGPLLPVDALSDVRAYMSRAALRRPELLPVDVRREWLASMIDIAGDGSYLLAGWEVRMARAAALQLRVDAAWNAIRGRR